MQDQKKEIEFTAQRISLFLKDEKRYLNPGPEMRQLQQVNKVVDKVLLLNNSSANIDIHFQFCPQDDSIKTDQLPFATIKDFIKSKSNQQWIETFNKSDDAYNLMYISKISEEKLLLIYFDVNYLVNFFAGFELDKGGFAIVFNADKNLIYHPLLNKGLVQNLKNIPERIMAKMPNQSFWETYSQQKAGFSIQKIKLHEDDVNYVTFIMYDPAWNWYIAVNQPHSLVFADLYNYFKGVGLWYLMAIILMSYLIIVTNLSISKSLNNIVLQLVDSKYLQLKVSDHENETSIIRRGIDLLNNQLDHYAKNIERNEVSKKKIEHDLELAKRLQRNILPAATASVGNYTNFEIFAISESAFDIGGDLFDYYMLDENRLLFVVGDVSGKGIQASLFMIFTQTLLRAQAKPWLHASEIVEKLNNKLLDENISDLFVTLFLGIFDTRTGVLSYCNAGHCVPILVQGKGNLLEMNQIHGIPVGIYPNRQYKTSEIKLEANDMLIVYTDGIVDASDENGMKFSEDVLKYNLTGTWFLSATETVEKIKSSVVSFRGNVSPEDDLTLLAVKYTPGANSEN